MNENDVPTRADIQAALESVLSLGGTKAKDKKLRNQQRRSKVQQLLDATLLLPVEKDKILDDLVSYGVYEDEVDA